MSEAEVLKLISQTEWRILGILIGVMAIQTTLMMSYFSTISSKMDRGEEKLLDIDRRLCRIEGAMMNKECCLLKDQSKEKAV